jgi:AraC-like DNA-binding protein
MSRHSDDGPAPATTPQHRVGGYHEFAPPPDLADAVEAMWTHDAGVQVALHRGVPDAAVSLCFMGPRAPDGACGAARLRVIGPVTAPQLFAPPIGHRMEALRVKLEWCRSLVCFHALLRASDLAPRPSWAALAADHGYADQSHLIREVQHLAGVSPSARGWT